MAALFQPADNSEHATPREESFNEETLDQACDVILVVEDGKEFKAHKNVLSEASPFFEKMLSTDMKESIEGMVRLEMFSESVMRNTLEFIYTGSVQKLAEHNARDLIVIADYLFLHNLKTLAEDVLLRKLNTSNCVSTYYCSQRYRCEGLFAKSKTFILTNFTAVYETNPEEVLNMSSKDIEMLISSDEIDVRAEEDVFRIILAWIDCDKSRRMKYFAELFRQVRLVYVSRDFLCSDIVTNDLVKDNEGCLDLVEDAMRLIDFKDFGNLSVTPRKSLETPVIVTHNTFIDVGSPDKVTDIQCYFPREDTWCSVGDLSCRSLNYRNTVSCRDKLYRFETNSCQLTSYNLYSNYFCKSLPQREVRKFQRFFVGNDDEIYVLVSERLPGTQCRDCGELDPTFNLFRFLHGWCDHECDRKNHVCYITKYKPESNAWEDISLIDDLYLREDFCIVAKDNFIYFIRENEGFFSLDFGFSFKHTNVDRYDLSRNQWAKVADIQEPKMFLSGAVVNEHIFIAGKQKTTWGCEVYSETTNQWQFITSFNMILDVCPKLLSVDGTLYALGIVSDEASCSTDDSPDIRVQCFDPDQNEWNSKTEIHQLGRASRRIMIVNAFSARVFKGFFPNHPSLKKQRQHEADGRNADAKPRASGSLIRGGRPQIEEPVHLTRS